MGCSTGYRKEPLEARMSETSLSSISFLTAKQVAQIFGVTPKTIYAWVRADRGFPKPVRQRKRYTRWDSRDILAELNRRPLEPRTSEG